MVWCQTGVLADTDTCIFSGIGSTFQYWYQYRNNSSCDLWYSHCCTDGPFVFNWARLCCAPPATLCSESDLIKIWPVFRSPHRISAVSNTVNASVKLACCMGPLERRHYRKIVKQRDRTRGKDQQKAQGACVSCPVCGNQRLEVVYVCMGENGDMWLSLTPFTPSSNRSALHCSKCHTRLHTYTHRHTHTHTHWWYNQCLSNLI